MFNRQATRIILLLSFLTGLSACASSNVPLLTPTTISSPTSSPTPLPPVPTLTPTPLTCLSQPGQLQTGEVPTNGTPTSFYIYLPPCYGHFTEQRYPVLYLLNGQPFENDPSLPAGDQWLRIGAPAAADSLIISGQIEPFIIVFPDDRYWNVMQGQFFGQFLVNDIVPFVDGNFRTIADRPHRAVGGLSRGGGWALTIMLTRPDVFGAVGLHAPAVRWEDRPALEYTVSHTPPQLWPRLYIDSGYDQERGYNTILEGIFTRYNVPHEWHLNIGAHTLEYWTAHVTEYLQWYAEGFATAGPPLPTSTPQPTVAPDSTLPATASAPAESSATTTQENR
jgi:enterochelin esterase-like enzyme